MLSDTHRRKGGGICEDFFTRWRGSFGRWASDCWGRVVFGVPNVEGRDVVADAKTEDYEIKRAGGTPVKNSGRGLRKGDGILEPFLIDVKEYATGFTVSRAAWAKLQTDAMQNGRRHPMFILVLGAEDEQPIRVWCMSERMGKEMLEAWKEKYEIDGEG